MSESHPYPRSPIDTMAAPEQLAAHVVMPGPRPAIHGYAVDDDLAANYSFAEVTLLSLTGEVPDEQTGRLFEIALSVAAPISVAQAPSHAAVLVALCEGRAAGVAGAGAIGLAEQARVWVSEQQAFIDWLESPQQDAVPQAALAGGEAHERVVSLRALLARHDVTLPWLELPLTWSAALLGLLHHCGLSQPWQLEAALCVARWPVLLAEANAAREGGLRNYPIRLPPFGYISPDSASTSEPERRS